MSRFGRVAVATALAAMVLGLGACGGDGDEPSRDDAGAVTEASDSADVFSLRVGDCLPSQDSLQGEVNTAGVVPCSETHDSEIYAAVTATGTDFPGREAVDKQANDGCLDAFEPFVGIAIDTSELDFSYLSPTAESWAGGDREILCVIVDPAGGVTGSLKGAKR